MDEQSLQQNILCLKSASCTYHVSEYDPQSDRSNGDSEGAPDGEEDGYTDGKDDGPPEG